MLHALLVKTLEHRVDLIGLCFGSEEEITAFENLVKELKMSEVGVADLADFHIQEASA